MNAINNEWEFLIGGGSPHLLREWGTNHTGYDLHFYIADTPYDAPSDDFRFNTWFCNGVADVKKALEIGTELLVLLNGACNFFVKNHDNFYIADIWYNGTRCSRNVTTLNPIQLDLLYFDFSKHEYEEHKKRVSHNTIFNLINLSKSRRDVYELLSLFSTRPDWRALSTIYEMVIYFAEERSIFLNIDEEKENAFFGVANNYSVLGLYARHGPTKDGGSKRRWQDPNKPKGIPAKTLSFDEASAFVREFVKNYLHLTHRRLRLFNIIKARGRLAELEQE